MLTLSASGEGSLPGLLLASSQCVLAWDCFGACAKKGGQGGREERRRGRQRECALSLFILTLILSDQAPTLYTKHTRTVR